MELVTCTPKAQLHNAYKQVPVMEVTRILKYQIIYNNLIGTDKLNQLSQAISRTILYTVKIPWQDKIFMNFVYL